MEARGSLCAAYDIFCLANRAIKVELCIPHNKVDADARHARGGFESTFKLVATSRTGHAVDDESDVLQSGTFLDISAIELMMLLLVGGGEVDIVSAAAVGLVVADRLNFHVMIVRKLLATSLNSVVVMMLVLAVSMGGRVGFGLLAALLDRGGSRDGSGSGSDSLLLAAASGRQTAIENAAADATSRLEIGAVLLKGLGKMSAASRALVMAIFVVSMLMVGSGYIESDMSLETNTSHEV